MRLQAERHLALSRQAAHHVRQPCGQLAVSRAGERPALVLKVLKNHPARLRGQIDDLTSPRPVPEGRDGRFHLPGACRLHRDGPRDGVARIPERQAVQRLQAAPAAMESARSAGIKERRAGCGDQGPPGPDEPLQSVQMPAGEGEHIGRDDHTDALRDPVVERVFRDGPPGDERVLEALRPADRRRDVGRLPVRVQIAGRAREQHRRLSARLRPSLEPAAQPVPLEQEVVPGLVFGGQTGQIHPAQDERKPVCLPQPPGEGLFPGVEDVPRLSGVRIGEKERRHSAQPGSLGHHRRLHTQAAPAVEVGRVVHLPDGDVRRIQAALGGSPVRLPAPGRKRVARQGQTERSRQLPPLTLQQPPPEVGEPLPAHGVPLPPGRGPGRPRSLPALADVPARLLPPAPGAGLAGAAVMEHRVVAHQGVRADPPHQGGSRLPVVLAEAGVVRAEGPRPILRPHRRLAGLEVFLDPVPALFHQIPVRGQHGAVVFRHGDAAPPARLHQPGRGRRVAVQMGKVVVKVVVAAAADEHARDAGPGEGVGVSVQLGAGHAGAQEHQGGAPEVRGCLRAGAPVRDGQHRQGRHCSERQQHGLRPAHRM